MTLTQKVKLLIFRLSLTLSLSTVFLSPPEKINTDSNVGSEHEVQVDTNNEN